MKRKIDYIPRADAKFDAWQENFMTIVGANLTPWGIPGPEYTRLIPFRDRWRAAWAKARNRGTRTPADVKEKKEARKAYERELRRFINQWIRHNPRITPKDREALNIPERKIEKTERTIIDTAPFVVMISEPGARILIRCRIKEDSTRASRHPLAEAIEMKYKIGEPPPTSPEECPHSITFTKALHTITFSIAQAGMRIYAYFKWKNITDDTKSGPWSKRCQAIIAE